MALGTLFRAVFPVVWAGGCMRDECGYQRLAEGIVRGEGLSAVENWLWAPGYPYLLAVFEAMGDTDGIRALQVVVGALSTWLMYLLVERLFDRRAALVATFLYALHPTLAFYAGRFWSEALYAPLLLLAAWSLLWAREGKWTRALVPGALVGLCVLFRGVATYMAPCFALAAVWPVGTWRDALSARWRHALAVFVAAFVVVAPYSTYATYTHGGFVLTDATMGRMMYLGNNDYPPTTWDYGNGWLRNTVLHRYERQGRPQCPKNLGAVEADQCEREAGVAWIKEHPTEFLGRVPMRVAQTLNPHSFLTRHLRLGKMPTMPWQLKEVLVLAVALWSYVIIVGGTLAIWARGRGPYTVLAATVVVYHIAAIAALAGLTRYRVPLEPLWIPFAAVLISSPKATLSGLQAPGRLIGGVACSVAVFVLMARYFYTGWPGWLW